MFLLNHRWSLAMDGYNIQNKKQSLLRKNELISVLKEILISNHIPYGPSWCSRNSSEDYVTETSSAYCTDWQSLNAK